MTSCPARKDMPVPLRRLCAQKKARAVPPLSPIWRLVRNEKERFQKDRISLVEKLIVGLSREKENRKRLIIDQSDESKDEQLKAQLMIKWLLFIYKSAKLLIIM